MTGDTRTWPTRPPSSGSAMTDRENDEREQLSVVTRRWSDVVAYMEAEPS